MKKVISKIYLMFICFIKKLIRLKGKISDTYYERAEDRAVCNKHKDDWQQLTKAELKDFKREKYTYTIFKNLSPEFEQHKNYYVSDEKYIRDILTRLNSEAHTAEGMPIDTIFNDKNYFEILFPQITFPKVIARCIGGNFFDESYAAISKEEAYRKLDGYSAVVFKQSKDSQHGSGIKPAYGEQIAKIFEDYGNNFIVQELIKQHSFLAEFNESSVNVIRVTTVSWKGHSYVLDSRLRIGAPGSFCDHLDRDGKNPVEIGISEDGKLKEFALVRNEYVLADNIFGKKIEGVVPAFNQMLDIALKGQSLYPTYGLLGWDFTVAEDGTPVCIEVNSKLPGIKSGQCINGPIFMKKTVDGNPLLDEIMSEPIKLKDLKIL